MSFDRTTPARKPGRYIEDLETLSALIADALIGHVAFVHEGQPVVIPTAVALDAPDGLLLHGSSGSGWMRHLATGAPVSVAVTALDALVVARSAFESSMRYRSAVVFGTCTVLEGAAKQRALETLTNHLIPGRVAEVRPSSTKELAATMALRLQIDDLTLKANSEAWPTDPDEDVMGEAWAGVVRRRTSYDEPQPAKDLREGIAVSPAVTRLLG